MINASEKEFLNSFSCYNDCDKRVEKILNYEKKYKINSMDMFWEKENFEKEKEDWKKEFDAFLEDRDDLRKLNQINPIKIIGIIGNDKPRIKTFFDLQFCRYENCKKFILAVNSSNTSLNYIIRFTNANAIPLYIYCDKKYTLNEKYNNIWLIRSENPKTELLRNCKNFAITENINTDFIKRFPHEKVIYF